MNRILMTLLLAAPMAANATVLTLVDVPEGQEIGQSGDDPCVIGDSSCGNNQPATMPWTTITNADGASWDLASPVYNIGVLLASLGPGGTDITVGIDVNITGNSTETLDYFQVVIDGVIAHFWGNGTTIGVGDNAGVNLASAVALANGTGMSDWVLQSFDLAGLEGSSIQFFAGMENTGDGKEQFFLTNDFGDPPMPMPEPGILMLLGTGLLGLALGRRRRA